MSTQYLWNESSQEFKGPFDTFKLVEGNKMVSVENPSGVYSIEGSLTLVPLLMV